jgi:outer membrane protein OmpA-like peptidoglycan-associated protein
LIAAAAAALGIAAPTISNRADFRTRMSEEPEGEYAAFRPVLPAGCTEKEEWRAGAETGVHFEAGSSTLTPAERDALRLIASTAKAHGNYLLSVGNPATSRLSDEQVRAIVDFLQQTGGIPPGRLLPPSVTQARCIPSLATESGAVVPVRLLVPIGQS